MALLHRSVFGSRLMWLLVTIWLFAGVIVFTAMSTMQFLSMAVITTTFIIPERPMEFPSVTICNANRFRKSVLQRHILECSNTSTTYST